MNKMLKRLIEKFSSNSPPEAKTEQVVPESVNPEWNLDKARIQLNTLGPTKLLKAYFGRWFKRGAHEHEIQVLGVETFVAVKKTDFPLLERQMRSMALYQQDGASGWFGLKPRHLQRETRFVPIGLASFHGNGYVRQVAIERMVPGEGKWLSFLLLRVNDWAPEVRNAAIATLDQYFEPAFHGEWVENLPLVAWLRTCNRYDHSGLVKKIETYLLTNARNALVSGFQHPKREVRRLAFQWVFEGNQGGHEALDTALRDQDMVIRRMAAKKVAGNPNAWAGPAILEVMKLDRAMSVRREYLYARIAQEGTEDQALFRPFLLDVNPTMRHMARFYLKENDPTYDFPQIYRAALSEAKRKSKIPCLLGLAEVGSLDDAKRIAEHWSSTLPSVRVAVVKSLVILGSKDHDDLFIEALIDDHPGVSKEGKNAFRKKALSRTPRDLWQLLQPSRQDHVYKNIFQIIQATSRWDGLSVLVTATAEDHPKVRDLARAALGKWTTGFNSWFAEPKVSEKQAIRQAIAILKVPSDPVFAELFGILIQHGVIEPKHTKG